MNDRLLEPDEVRETKLLIALSAYMQVMAPTAASIANVTAYLSKRIKEVEFGYTDYLVVDDSRNFLAKLALENGHTHVLFIDSDMLIPAEGVFKLIRRDLEIVGAIYANRHQPTFAAFSELDKETGYLRAFDSSIKDKEELLPAVALGMGCTLVKTDALRKMDERLGLKGCFFDRIRLNALESYGEDVSFCLRAIEAGIQPYLDTSVKAGHVGRVFISVNNEAMIAVELQ